MSDKQTKTGQETVKERVVICDGKLPILLVYETDAVPGPAVIVLQGTRRSKETSFHDHDQYLKESHFVRVYPDAPLHGERQETGHPLAEDSAWENYMLGQGDALHEVMIPVVHGMAKEVSCIIDYLDTRQDLIIPRYGVYGFSVAGLMGFMAANLEPRLHAAVCLCTPPRFLFMSIGGPYAWSFETLEEAAEFDPMNKPGDFLPTALFFGHGQMDDVVPIEAIRDVYHRLLPYYRSNPQDLVLKEYPHIRHYLDKPFPYTNQIGREEVLQLRKEALDWLKSHLKDDLPD